MTAFDVFAATVEGDGDALVTVSGSLDVCHRLVENLLPCTAVRWLWWVAVCLGKESGFRSGRSILASSSLLWFLLLEVEVCDVSAVFPGAETKCALNLTTPAMFSERNNTE